MNLDDLIPLVIMEAPAVPDPVASYQLVLAARELCTMSLAWQADVTVKPTGKATYSFEPDDGELVEPISGVYAVSDGGTTSVIRPSVPARLNLENPSWATQVGSPLWYLMPDQTTIQFVPNPTQGTAVIRVALQPTMTGKSIDDRVGNFLRETIVHGALLRLFRMPKREWTDVGIAAYYDNCFERGVANAQTRGVDGFAKVNRTVRYGGL